MSIRISKGGRLFGIVAALGGAVMIGGAALTWTKAVRVTYFVPYEISELNGAERIATLVLGLLVIAGAACFIALGSRRVWLRDRGSASFGRGGLSRRAPPGAHLPSYLPQAHRTTSRRHPSGACPTPPCSPGPWLPS
jgi:hypothetical protein